MKILYLPSCRSQQRQFQNTAVHIYPVLMAMEATKKKQEGNLVCWGNESNLTPHCFDKIITESEGLPFLELPIPDRVFTRAKEYTSGNYKYLPGTHLQSASGCWHAKCSFCVEKDKPYLVRPVKSVIEEVAQIIKLGFKECFDDSGTFPIGMWLALFCEQMIVNGYNKKIRIGCNMRLDYHHPNLAGMRDMRRVGFRMILYGLESANQNTLDKINKGVNIESAIEYIKRSAKAGLEPHICVVFGWEWETNKEAINTLKLVWYLLRKGYAKTAQASFICQQGIKGNESQRHFVRDIYGVWKYPSFWFHKLIDLRNIDDLKYIWRSIKKGVKR